MLDERQLVVCELIASGIPITEVSEQSGVARSTIYEWKKLDEVKARVDVLGQEYLSQTIANIKVMLALNAPVSTGTAGLIAPSKI